MCTQSFLQKHVRAYPVFNGKREDGERGSKEGVTNTNVALDISCGDGEQER